ncbi:uncharacterized protein LOC125595444 [Brassica napus]|uniref:uncharacterized protein LOC106320567 n=1 Tax=Brassica oleracea var. oleracea TaxID=109376 RepID=UPI0006A6DB31|nr:PREDICTED: uncharacterized protein LOC106320567 [Brassica oleracea var. oleracea]XP_013614406.1 PREDICTED: uncharacterized protein LOC106320568 [Brassica oleracea var. oleracea]XP_013718780.1 uncharacterized protein LOC106422535 [Brassica napus]XP_013731832.1 uncharacterized protein LOC106435481 [Brassica napus]XP_048627184.1 uncharacterized protein LOC125595444 [Brassica napus]
MAQASQVEASAYCFLRAEIESGSCVFFWSDDWLGLGKLRELIWTEGTHYMGLSMDANVCDAVVNGNWKFGHRRRRLHSDLYDRIMTIKPPTLADGDDIFLWKHDMISPYQVFQQQALGIRFASLKIRLNGTKSIGFLREFLDLLISLGWQYWTDFQQE